MIFSEVRIDTLVGAVSVVGDRTNWSLEELREAFAVLPEGATVMDYIYTKDKVFEYIFSMNADRYVDWETGTCSFTSEAFRSDLEFINSFPDTVDLSTEGGWQEINAEITSRTLNGLQMLTSTFITRPTDIQCIDAFYGQGGRAALVGYPTGDGSAGSSFRIMNSENLAMSSACRDKKAAWEFLRQLLLRRYPFESADILRKAEHGSGSTSTVINIPINRADYDTLLQADTTRSTEYPPRSRALLAGPTLDIRPATEEEVQRFESFLNSVEKIYLADNEIYSIVREISGPYFAGDKTLDETVELIQSRVTLYVNEKR